MNAIDIINIINTPDQQKKFKKIQNQLREKISLSDDCYPGFDPGQIRTVAGVDLAYWKDPDQQESAVCCIVVLDAVTHEVLETQRYYAKVTVPYIPGFLAFRELPLILETVKLLKHKPELYMFDGNGYLHPRHMGIATHAGLCLETPAIGVAKTYFRVDRQTDYIEPEQTAGSYTDIVIQGEVYGRALRTHTGVKPVFVSAGHGISLETATALTMQFVGTESRVPIPTRLADLETHTARARLLCRA